MNVKLYESYEQRYNDLVKEERYKDILHYFEPFTLEELKDVHYDQIAEDNLLVRLFHERLFEKTVYYDKEHKTITFRGVCCSSTKYRPESYKLPVNHILEFLEENGIENLEYLDLSDCKLVDADISYLAVLTDKIRVRNLNLSENSLQLYFVIKFSELYKNVLKVDISDNPFNLSKLIGESARFELKMRLVWINSGHIPSIECGSWAKNLKKYGLTDEDIQTIYDSHIAYNSYLERVKF